MTLTAKISTVAPRREFAPASMTSCCYMLLELAILGRAKTNILVDRHLPDTTHCISIFLQTLGRLCGLEDVTGAPIDIVVYRKRVKIV